MTTSQSYLITGTVDGKPIGTFDTFSGGGSTAEINKHRPGGMQPENTSAALPTYDDVTIGRELELERDVEQHRWLNTRTGRALATVSKQPLDENGSPWGKPTTYSGRLQAVTDPESDSNSTDRSMYELTFVITGRS